MNGLEQAAAATTPSTSTTKAVTFTPSVQSSSSPRPAVGPAATSNGPNPLENKHGKTICSSPYKTYQNPVHKSHKVFIDSHHPSNNPDNRPIRYLAVPQRLMSVRNVSLLNPFPVPHHARLNTAAPALSSDINRPIACNFPPPGWRKMLQSADSLGCLVLILLRVPFFYPVCKN